MYQGCPRATRAWKPGSQRGHVGEMLCRWYTSRVDGSIARLSRDHDDYSLLRLLGIGSFFLELHPWLNVLPRRRIQLSDRVVTLTSTAPRSTTSEFDCPGTLLAGSASSSSGLAGIFG